MNYGLYYKFDVKSGEITAIEQNPMTKNSVAVSFLTIEASLAEGQFLEVTFGKFDNNAYTVLTPALGFISINANPETYQTAIPDLIFKESGKYAFSLSVKTPVVQSDGSTDYAVLTSVQAGFTVDNTIAVISHNPLTPTEVDTINAELAVLSKRVSIVESKVTNTVVVDFSVNEETGVATIIYNNGTTKTVQLPLETIDAVYQTGLVTVLNFTEDSWESDGNGGYLVAFGSEQTGQGDKNFIVQLCASGTEPYKAGTETAESAKQGDYTRADTVFKGSDGSLLLYSTTIYGGSLVIMSGALKAAIVQETGNATDKAMSQKAVTDELDKKVDKASERNSVYSVDDKGNTVQRKYSSSNLTSGYFPLRTTNGHLIVPQAGYEDNYAVAYSEIANLKEQINSGYEKIPHYALIEKIIVGYSLLVTEPEDFTTNFSSYYKTNGKARNNIDFAYVALTEAEEFETGKYYSKATENTATNRSGSANYEPDGTKYAFNNIYAYIENATENLPRYSLLQYYSEPSHVLLGRIYANTDATQNTRILQFSVGVKGNMVEVNAAMLATAERSQIVYTNKKIVKDENFYLAGFYISPLQVDTTILIYGVRK